MEFPLKNMENKRMLSQMHFNSTNWNNALLPKPNENAKCMTSRNQAIPGTCYMHHLLSYVTALD
jgi:hypothetical protein